MQLKVTYKGQPYDLPKSGIREFVYLERQFGISAAKLQDDSRIEYMAYLAYLGLVKLGVINKAVEPYGDGDAFLDGLDDFEVDETDETPDPTTATAQLTG